LRLDGLHVVTHARREVGAPAAARELKGLPFLRALWVCDAEGRHHRRIPTRATSAAAMGDRPYFQAFVQAATPSSSSARSAQPDDAAPG
jgi:hypothetical protein